MAVEATIDLLLDRRRGCSGVFGEARRESLSHPRPELGRMGDHFGAAQLLGAGHSHRKKRRRLVDGEGPDDFGRDIDGGKDRRVIGREQISRIGRIQIEEGGLIGIAGRSAAEAADRRAGRSSCDALDKGHGLEGRKALLDMGLVAVGEQFCPEHRGAMGDLARDVDGRLDVTQSVMRIVRGEAVQRCDAVQLEAHPAIGIHGPLEQFGLAMPDGIERGQDAEPGIAIELGGEDIGLQVLIEGLA